MLSLMSATAIVGLYFLIDRHLTRILTPSTKGHLPGCLNIDINNLRQYLCRYSIQLDVHGSENAESGLVVNEMVGDFDEYLVCHILYASHSR